MNESVVGGPERTSPQVYVVAIFMVGFHIACLGVFFVGFSWTAFACAVAMYVIRGLGITGGYHRLLAHRSFKASRPVQLMFALAGSLAVQGGPLWWVAHHRSHHRDTDSVNDIHSPVTKGFWQSHMGWMMTNEAFNEKGANARDLHKFPELKLLQRYYAWLIFAEILLVYLFGVALSYFFSDLGTTGLQILVWGFFVSTVFTWHTTFMVNSVCHTWGSRPYPTGDASTNNLLIGVLAFGEGWHNNHHMFPLSSRHGLVWWQLDITYWMLRGLEKLGLVSDLKLPKFARPTESA
ncbi:MAG: fatty acid desaturase [Proteobacteria bacterium]|nr:fatty acid desaturase [Pseudomonadota bacterium]